LSHRVRLAAVVSAVLMAVLAAAGARAQPVTAHLTFLHFNDAYQISPRRGLGGFGPLATLIKRERARAPDAVLTFGGDLISPSLLSGITKGRHMIEFANLLGVQMAVLGNHEFDFGVDVMRRRIAESKFPWLGANVLGPDGKPYGGAFATRILTVGKIKVGFLGLVTPDAREAIHGGVPVTFAPVLPAARLAVAQLKQEGAQVIVALTHLNLAEDRELVRDVRGLNLVLGGHDHIPITVYEHGVLILKAGSDAEFLGVVDLDVTIDKGQVDIVPSWRLVANYRITADPAIQRVVRGYEQRLDKELAQTIGKTATPMDSHAKILRFHEAAIGSLFADAIRDDAKADVAIVNGGGIRGNKSYPAGARLTRRDIFAELPFGNVVMVLAVPGTALRAMMEHGLAQYGEEFGGFPQISGMIVTFDPAKPAGSRVLSISVGGAPLDPDRIYRLATNDFLASGGNGYAMLAGLKRLIDDKAGPLMSTVVIDYIQRRGTVAPEADGRLVAK
jgi:2',3'-cyclic-nucleotide 2'-phosphodiesterase (5'-nucleotidase family)